MKGTLPKDWITVQSKKYPARVYYFNVKTNKTTWTRPENNVNESPSKMSKASKRRKNEEETEKTAPLTPEETATTSTPEQARPKLKARRTLPPKMEKGPRVSVETPQMKLMREKILERQSKGTPKKSKITVDVDLKTPQKIPEPAKEEKLVKKALITAATMTPQMKEVYERLKAKRALMKPKPVKPQLEPLPQVSPPKESLPETESKDESSRRGRSRARSMGPTQSPLATPDTSTSSTNRRKTLYIPSTKSERQKSGSDTECAIKPGRISPKKRSITPQIKKNIAQARIEKLRRSLVVEAAEEDSPRAKKKKYEVSPQPSSSKADEIVSPTIYKSAEARLQALTERLRSESQRVHEEINSTKESTLGCLRRSEPASPRSMLAESSLFLQDLSHEEAMEWEPIEDDVIMQEIQAVRNELSGDPHDVPMGHPEESSLDLVDGQVESCRRALYIVIDTNVFLSNIQAVEEARDTVFKTHGRPLIVIPWTVVRELDYIKDDRTHSRPESLKSKARHAVRFLHRHFSDKHPRVLGQTARDVVNNREIFAAECPDDEILQACLQIQKTNNSVVLLSYDRNLCNKAMIHDIATLGRNDPLEKVDYLMASEYRAESLLTSHLNQNGSNPRTPTAIHRKELSIAEDLFEEIKAILTDFLTKIVATEMQNLYGENWEKYVIISPPWTAVTVLKCAIKHWMAAVNDSFIRRAESILKELHDIINKFEMNRRLRDVEHVIDLANDLIQCLIVKKYPNLVQRVGLAIQELRGRHREAVRAIQEEDLQDKVDREGNQEELEIRAQIVFNRFETIYSLSRDVCGAACELAGMKCLFTYQKLAPEPDENIKNLQPEIAANLNRLLLVLSRALEDLNLLHKDHRSVLALYDSLQNFFPENDLEVSGVFFPIDVYTCLKYKEKQLRLGVPQLQQLIDHFCRLATFRCR